MKHKLINDNRMRGIGFNKCGFFDSPNKLSLIYGIENSLKKLSGVVGDFLLTLSLIVFCYYFDRFSII